MVYPSLLEITILSLLVKVVLVARIHQEVRLAEIAIL
tara:strand:- start:430 stop:540 length:111 start_codon:yes stop_codon:yes gene_type:complete